MLYDSINRLSQTILQALQTSDDNRWDDQTESGNACLYEMHQMSKSLYPPYRHDRPNHHLPSQRSLPERLATSIPHVRTMVIAIRHRDQLQALESGRAAWAEMNCAVISVGRTESATETKEAALTLAASGI
jgi:hypothetical protein